MGEEKKDEIEWLEIGTVPICLAVDGKGEPMLAMFFRNAIGDGELSTGEKFDLGIGMQGSIVVNLHGSDHVFVLTAQDVMEKVNDYMAEKEKKA